MIYPKKISAKKKKILLKFLIGISILIAIILIIINKLTTPNVQWAAISIIGIVYVWITVMYSINKNTNIAAHVLIQTLTISAVTIGIDYFLGKIDWSLSLAIPIIIIIANATMFVLTIVSSRRYMRYAIYQFLILIFSMIPILFIYENIIQFKILSYVAIGISGINFLLTMCLCAREIIDEVAKTFHM